jgi:two-component system response regulator HupR/HoxA
LRSRREDIPPLVAKAIDRFAERHRKQIGGIEAEALDCLAHFDWPGNIRQLHNEVERAVVLARDGDTIGLDHLSELVVSGEDGGRGSGLEAETSLTELAVAATSPEAGDGAGGAGPAAKGGASSRPPFAPGEVPVGPLREARSSFEAGYIARALTHHGGNVSRTARTLGVSRFMLQKKIRDYHLR